MISYLELDVRIKKFIFSKGTSEIKKTNGIRRKDIDVIVYL
jgi:hypothetical protein